MLLALILFVQLALFPDFMLMTYFRLAQNCLLIVIFDGYFLWHEKVRIFSENVNIIS